MFRRQRFIQPGNLLPPYFTFEEFINIYFLLVDKGLQVKDTKGICNQNVYSQNRRNDRWSRYCSWWWSHGVIASERNTFGAFGTSSRRSEAQLAFSHRERFPWSEHLLSLFLIGSSSCSTCFRWISTDSWIWCIYGRINEQDISACRLEQRCWGEITL